MTSVPVVADEGPIGTTDLQSELTLLMRRLYEATHARRFGGSSVAQCSAKR
jgi:hypothetical protein